MDDEVQASERRAHSVALIHSWTLVNSDGRLGSVWGTDPVTRITYHGAGSDTQFCDWSEVNDSLDCDDDRLWSIEDRGTRVGFVCSNHIAGYVSQMDHTTPDTLETDRTRGGWRAQRDG